MVWVEFDSSLISYDRLLEEFWTMHDPTTLNRQGNDIGSQYRSVIYTTSDDQMAQAMNSCARYQSALTSAGLGEIVTEILPAKGVSYFAAEDYHQRYLEKNPNGYDCHSSTGISFPKVSL